MTTKAGFRLEQAIDAVTRVSRKRQARWMGKEEWTVLEWAGALCGEAGEAANVAKKLRRIASGVKGNRRGDGAVALRRKLASELADVFLYLIVLADTQQIDLSQAIVRAFNKKSFLLGFPERL